MKKDDRPNRPDPPPRWDFWKNHPNYARYRWNHLYRWTTWAALGAWFPWYVGGQEVYYDYGDNIYYEGENVYQDGNVIATTEEYAAQAEELATDVPKTANDTEWMSLGVFAATAKDGGASGVDPAVYLQLNVSRAGVIGGTVHNSETDTTSSIEGMVDRKSQRAAWIITGKKSPIMESGIANLTKDESSALLHFDNDVTQQWSLLRLEEPKEGERDIKTIP